MKLTTTKTLIGAALAAAAMFTSGSAFAEGLAASPSDLPAKERAALETAIAEDKAHNPAIYEKVRNVSGYKPETYRKFRNPVPLVGRELRRFGSPALLPMLEALAFDAWDRGDATDAEWRALEVGMLEAVAHLRDRRSAPVVRVAFSKAQHQDVQRAAAEAVGSLCAEDAAMLPQLEAALKSDGAKRLAAIDGLGQCRVVGATDLLVDALGSTTKASEASRIAKALGYQGSSWAWRAIAKSDPSRAKEGLEMRRRASDALAKGFLRFGGKARAAHQVGLTMVQHPEIRAIAEPLRAGAQPSVFAQLERVVDRIEKRAKR